ncbi:MAG: Hpt domain-containing protein, partial [Planctomycetota bacterium]
MKIDNASLVQTFLAESGENLATMEEALVVLEVKPEDQETLDDIFRAAHTLKGNAAALGFPGLSEFAHAVEDLLEPVRQRTVPVTGELITDLLHAIDVLRELVPAAAEGNDGLDETQRAIIEQLRTISPAAPSGRAKRTKTSRTRQPAAATRTRSADRTSLSDRSRTLRVGIGKLDRMLTLAGETAIARGRMGALLASETP